MKDFVEQKEWTQKLKGYYPDGGMKVLANGEYIVEIHKSSCRWGESIRLAIKRSDRLPIHSWADIQEIKNKIAGIDRVAIEIYPRNEDVTDTSNMYHLWVLPIDFELPYQLIPYKCST